jgi:hypothetical protein
MDGVCPLGVWSDPHAVGFRVVEGTLTFGKAFPFAGRRWNGGLGRFVRTVGASSPPFEESTTHKGARVSSNEEGNLHLRRSAAAVGYGEVLRSGLLGPRNPASGFNDHCRKRWSDHGVACKATSAAGPWSSGLRFRVSL